MERSTTDEVTDNPRGLPAMRRETESQPFTFFYLIIKLLLLQRFGDAHEFLVDGMGQLLGYPLGITCS